MFRYFLSLIKRSTGRNSATRSTHRKSVHLWNDSHQQTDVPFIVLWICFLFFRLLLLVCRSLNDWRVEHIFKHFPARFLPRLLAFRVLCVCMKKCDEYLQSNVPKWTWSRISFKKVIFLSSTLTFAMGFIVRTLQGYDRIIVTLKSHFYCGYECKSGWSKRCEHCENMIRIRWDNHFSSVKRSYFSSIILIQPFHAKYSVLFMILLDNSNKDREIFVFVYAVSFASNTNPQEMPVSFRVHV